MDRHKDTLYELTKNEKNMITYTKSWVMILTNGVLTYCAKLLVEAGRWSGIIKQEFLLYGRLR